MLSEKLVKSALGSLNWEPLRLHFEDIVLTHIDLTDLCGHVRRCTDLICKHPRKKFKQKRTNFFNELKLYTNKHLGMEAEEELVREVELIELIEQGYQSILDTLDKCAIGKLPSTTRVAGIIRRVMAMGANSDKVLQEIAEISQHVKKARSGLVNKQRTQRGPVLINP